MSFKVVISACNIVDLYVSSKFILPIMYLSSKFCGISFTTFVVVCYQSAILLT